MTTQRRRDTACELLLRHALYALGLRYRVHRRVLDDLRRDADIVFVGARVAVFVDGCFWHGCRRHRRPVKENGVWWRAKLARTVSRDRDTNRRLRAAGWVVVRIWEHSDPHKAAERVAQLVRQRRG
jgi:DNA mismatch endonuclease (patch repair protein)